MDKEFENMEENNNGLRKVDLTQNPNMKLYRYMSFEEFIKMRAGYDIKPQKNTCEISRTNSEGICFLGEKTQFSTGDSQIIHTFSPESCINILSGIVTDDVLVEFSVTKDLDLNERLWYLCKSFF